MQVNNSALAILNEMVDVLGADDQFLEATFEQIRAHFDFELVLGLIVFLFLFRLRAEERERQQVVAFGQQSTQYGRLAT